ncbi:MAG: DUF2384 domain-containing protein [Parcubacteria group bacterium]|nr:DUF2384 domain-containing protein [Parcubacteria group bacterium]
MYNLRKVLSQWDIAAAMGVPVARVRQWEGTRWASRMLLRSLSGLLEILRVLEPHLTFRGMRQWMQMKNRWLNGARALDVYHERGGAKKVRKAIRDYVESGQYYR